MKLIELNILSKNRVKYINKYHQKLRLYGVKVGIAITVLYSYRDSLVVIVNDRETVIIPKEMTKYIIVEAIK